MQEPKVFCLITCSRSGSNLFHSLLDGHPDVLCFPRPVQFNEFWQGAKGRKEDKDYLVNSFIDKHTILFSGKAWIKYDRGAELGPKKDETFYVDADLFCKNALAELKDKKVSRAVLFTSFHKAYHAARGKVLPERPLIVNHSHYIDYVEEIGASLSDFPNSTFALLMIRHPIQKLNSCVNVMKWRDTLFCGELCARQKQILRGIIHLVERFPNLDVKYLPFEHLMMHPEQAMNAFTNWAKIKWNDSLLQSTVNDKLWWGNGRIPRNGIAPGWKVYRSLGFLETKDWTIFRGLIFKRMEKFGYLTEGKDMAKVGKAKLLALLLLPSRIEWVSLKSMFSPQYWSSVMGKIREKIRDSRLKKSDKYKQLSIYILRLNPVVWCYYFLRRIGYYYAFAIKDKGKDERLPLLLEGVNLPDEGKDRVYAER